MNKLNKEQKKALQAMSAGDNVFLTGPGGTGKSFVIGEFEKKCQRKTIIKCAPTGKAAINIHGVTCHSIFGIPWRVLNPGETGSIGKVSCADVVIIDEVSMLRIDVFEYIINTIKLAENVHNKKIQVILVGDFYQLPPVVDDKNGDKAVLSSLWNVSDYTGYYAFLSAAWAELNLKYCNLTEIMRQTGNIEFVKALNSVRIGDFEGAKWINEHCYSPTNDISKGLQVFPRKKAVEDLNKRELDKLKDKPVVYEADIVGDVRESDYPTERKLVLKPGARVVILVNDRDKLYVNGSYATVTRLFRDAIEVSLDAGPTVVLCYNTWQFIKSNVKHQGEEKKLSIEPVGEFSQLPVMLAYASTVHKVQGVTLDSLSIDPTCFAEGQLYVELSRCRTAEGLHLMTAITADNIKVHPGVKKFYHDLDNAVPSSKRKNSAGKNLKKLELEVNAVEKELIERYLERLRENNK